VGTVATAWETVVVVKLERANTWKASGTAHQTEKKWTLFFCSKTRVLNFSEWQIVAIKIESEVSTDDRCHTE